MVRSSVMRATNCGRHSALHRSTKEAALPDRSSLALARQFLAAGPSPSQQLAERELARRVRQAIEQLSPLDREVLLNALVGQLVEIQRVPLHAEQFLDRLVAGQPLQGEAWMGGSGVSVNTRGYQPYGAVIPLAITHSPPRSKPHATDRGEEHQAIEERPPEET